ncbi:hypothetical protein AB9K41_06940, partial [Cribrihabitans sp. XS_ASV171]
GLGDEVVREKTPEGLRLYGDPLDVVFWGRGMDIQTEVGLELIYPQGEITANGPEADPLKFEVHLDPRKIGMPFFEMDLFVSTQAPGEGLFPGDPFRERAWLGNDNPTESNDYHRYRLINSVDSIKNFAFQSGKKYFLKGDGKIDDSKTVDLTSADVNGVDPKHAVVIEVDPGFRNALTGSQSYYWGVKIKNSGGDLVGSRRFTTSSVMPKQTPYSTVNVLTHGFQIMGLLPDYANTALNEDTLAPWLESGELLSDASGGGTILVYNRQTGKWHKYDPEGAEGARISKSAFEASQLKEKEAVTLVLDWYRESNISDSGFSEAAADAFFASLVQLDLDTGGKIFKSPLHFIGHSRGTSVNSEIIQRLGVRFPESGDKNIDIHMTTLDPHDFKQDSLKVELKKIVESWITAAKFGATLTSFANPALGATLLRVINGVELGAQLLFKIAGYAGIQAAEIPWDDFKDPNVQIWSNIDFADNYFQTSAPEGDSNFNKFTGLKFVPITTPNGTKIPTDKDGKDKLPTKNGMGVPDIELDFTKAKVPGFIEADALATPHSRITNWYMGTADVNSGFVGGVLIPRTMGDEGLAINSTGDEGFFGQLGNALFGEGHTKQPYYGIDPVAFSNGKWGDVKTHFADYFRKANINPGTAQSNTTRTEAIGTGFYFSTVAGNPDIRPESGDRKRTSLDFDNTEVDRPAGTKENPVKYDPVPTVFNGDFSHGTRHALSNYIKWIAGAGYSQLLNGQSSWDDFKKALNNVGDKELSISKKFGGVASAANAILPDLPPELGRFPLHYDLPGWSMHGGIEGTQTDRDNAAAFPDGIDEGASYTFDLFSASTAESWGLAGPVDITGLFLMNMNFGAEVIDILGRVLKPLLEKVLQQYADKFTNDNYTNRYTDSEKKDLIRKDYAESVGGTVVPDGDSFKIVKDGETLLTSDQLSRNVNATFNFVIDDATSLRLLARAFDFVVDAASGSDVIKDALKSWGGDSFALKGGVPSLIKILDTPLDTSTPENEQASKAARAKAMSDYLAWIGKNLVALVTTQLGWDTKPNYALMFGGSQALKEMVRTFLPETKFSVGGNQISVPDMFDRAIDAVGQIDSLTHNRMFVPADMEEIKFDAFLPLNPSEEVNAEVVFTTMDGKEYTAKGLNTNDNGVVEKKNAYYFDRSFFSTQIARFEIPSEVRGKVANVTITNNGLERAPAANLAEELVDFLSNFSVFASVADAASVVMVIDNIRMTKSGSNQTATSIGDGATPITVIEAQALAEVAQGLWVDSELVPGAEGLLGDVVIRIADLDGAELALADGNVITLDADAAGHGWFVDATPNEAGEFKATDLEHLMIAGTDSEANGRIDLLTVLTHEMGNIMGLPDHVDPASSFVMSPVIDPGTRRLPIGPDVGDWSEIIGEQTDIVGIDGLQREKTPTTRETATGTPSPDTQIAGAVGEPFTNGGFDTDLNGWTTTGSVSAVDGKARLDESSGIMSGLSQGFQLPAGITALQFTLSDIALDQPDDAPPDAFEVALLDGATRQPILPAIANLSGTDAI